MTENSSIFKSLFKYLDNLSVLSSVMIIIAIFTCALIFTIYWLIIRKSKRWHSKVDLQLETLNRMDNRLINLESKFANITDLSFLEPTVKEDTEGQKEEEPLGSIEMNQPKINENIRRDRVKNISKTTGRIYTAEELEILIQE